MIFQHTWQDVISGKKNQTRRIVTPSTGFNCRANGSVVTYLSAGRYEVGKTYAVQPGRGKKSVGRIRITEIRREDVRNISDEDVKAEGFNTYSDFFLTWCKMHDKGMTLPIIPDYYTGNIVWQHVRHEVAARPARFYDAYVLTFELVERSQP